MKKLFTMLLLVGIGTTVLMAQQKAALPSLHLEAERIDTDRIIEGADEIILDEGTHIAAPIRLEITGCHSIRLGEGFSIAPGGELIARIDESCKQAASSAEPSGSLSIGPNPLRSELHMAIQVGTDSEVQGAMYDLHGRQVAELLPATRLEPGFHEFTADVQSLPPGTYLYRMSIGKEVRSGKLIRID